MPHLTIIRGLPGSGKTTFGRRIAPKPDFCISADDFMVNRDGNYEFSPNRLKEVHDACFRRVTEILSQGHDCVVANVFHTLWSFQRYISFCVDNGHKYTVIVMDQQFESVHNVPKDVVERYSRDWEW